MRRRYGAVQRRPSPMASWCISDAWENVQWSDVTGPREFPITLRRCGEEIGKGKGKPIDRRGKVKGRSEHTAA